MAHRDAGIKREETIPSAQAGIQFHRGNDQNMDPGSKAGVTSITRFALSGVTFFRRTDETSDVGRQSLYFAHFLINSTKRDPDAHR